MPLGMTKSLQDFVLLRRTLSDRMSEKSGSEEFECTGIQVHIYCLSGACAEVYLGHPRQFGAVNCSWCTLVHEWNTVLIMCTITAQ